MNCKRHVKRKKSYRLQKTMDVEQRYKTHRNKLNSLLRNSKKDYYSNLFKNARKKQGKLGMY